MLLISYLLERIHCSANSTKGKLRAGATCIRLMSPSAIGFNKETMLLRIELISDLFMISEGPVGGHLMVEPLKISSHVLFILPSPLWRSMVVPNFEQAHPYWFARQQSQIISVLIMINMRLLYILNSLFPFRWARKSKTMCFDSTNLKNLWVVGRMGMSGGLLIDALELL